MSASINVGRAGTGKSLDDLREPLFRREVLLARQGDWLGVINITPPRIGWLLLAAGLVIVAGVCILLLVGHYTRHERAQGRIVSSLGVLQITPRESGTVSRVFVEENSNVSEGQPLVEISLSQSTADGGDLGADLATQLAIKRSRLVSDSLQAQAQATADGKYLREEAALLRRQKQQVDAQADIQKAQMDAAFSLYRQWLALGSNGVVSKMQLLQQHDTAMAHESSLRELREKGLSLQGQLTELTGRLEQIPAASQGKENAIDQQLADVDAATAQNKLRRAYLIRAPRSGFVTNVLAQAGQPIVAEQPLLSIIPAGAVLKGELWLPSRSAGFLRRGESVRLRYSSYPYQSYGQYAGKVAEVSDSAVSAKEIARVSGQEQNEAAFRVIVDLDQQNVISNGASYQLRPGMTLSADLLLEDKRIVDWIMDPIRRVNHQSPRSFEFTGVAVHGRR